MAATDLTQLSKMLSHALRHAPESYQLQLDAQGWVALEDLVEALQRKGVKVDVETLITIVEQAEKKRHQVLDGKIRAYYGHSTASRIEKEPSEPPAVLYHGTVSDHLESIQQKGLLPMERQYVHLSTEEATARLVASRRKGTVVLLFINARQAYEEGISFYQEGQGIWLSDPIPAKYIVGV